MGVQVFENTTFVPVTAARGAPLPRGRLDVPGPADVVGWRPVLARLGRQRVGGRSRAGGDRLRRVRTGRQLLAADRRGIRR